MPVGPVSNQYLFNPDRAPFDIQMNLGQSQNPFTSRFTSSGVAIDYDGDPMPYAPTCSRIERKDYLGKGVSDGNGVRLQILTEFKFIPQPLSRIATSPPFAKSHIGSEVYTYTDRGLLQSAMHADGTMSSYEYDLIGRVVKETFPSGLTCSIIYDNANGTVTRSYSDNTTETETHDAFGNIVSFTDRAGNHFTSTFDGLGRIKSTTGPAGSSQSQAQSSFHVYNPAKACETVINAANEATSTFHDALGRPTLVTVYNSDGSVAQNTSYWYSGDHQSVVTTQGTGANAVTTTLFTDLQNRPLILKHADGGTQVTAYDAMGNKISFTDEMGNSTQWTYDALNHLVSETLPGGALINYQCNPAGELLTRAMPAGLTETNSYDAAGQKTADALLCSNGSSTRNHFYHYGNNGLVSSVDDPRGFTTSIAYDAWNHPTNISSSGAIIPEQNQTTAYEYDLLGHLTSVSQNYADSSTGPQTKVTRGYDGYGQIINETTSINNTNVSAWTQAWDGAGKRTGLNWTLDSQGPQYSFAYNALGLPTLAQNNSLNNSGSCSYTYADNGLLSSRITPFGNSSYTRNGCGEITGATLKNGSKESLSWRHDGRLGSYSLADNTGALVSETRNYVYDTRGRVTQEPFTSKAQGTQTANYCFDEDPLGSGVNVLTGIGNRTSALLNGTAYNQITRLESMPSLLIESNLGRNGSENHSNFSYDNAGEVYNHYFADEGYNKAMTWDSFGRLVKVAQTSYNDYNWSAIYDGLGRRIKTSYGVNSSPASYYYDPEVEFLELGHDNNGRTWNLYGPDRSGTYGGAQGIGGLEVTWQLSGNLINGSINNYFGDSLGTINSSGTSTSYNGVLGSYGPMPGSSVSQNLTPQWRGHYIDETGFYYMGARYYEPNSGRFLSADPLGHDASLSLYDYCDGDPVNGLDPDGRITIVIPGFGPQQDKGRDYSNEIFIRNALNANPGAQVFGRDNKSMGQATTVIQTAVQNGDHTVNIIGYSRGGYAAVKLAGSLNNLNITVNNLVTIDPVVVRAWGDTLPSPLPVPSNVVHATDYYQGGSQFQLLNIGDFIGTPFEEAVNAQNNFFNNIQGISHQTIPSIVNDRKYDAYDIIKENITTSSDDNNSTQSTSNKGGCGR